jgi:transcriptional regulator with XRE-family HTH domain
MEEKSYANVVGYKLQRIRKHYNISKENMAKSFGVTIAEYDKYESGEKFPDSFPRELIVMMYIDM